MSKGMSRQVRKGQPTPPFLVALRGEVIELLAPEISEKFTCMIQDLPTKNLPMFEKKSSSKPRNYSEAMGREAVMGALAGWASPDGGCYTHPRERKCISIGESSGTLPNPPAPRGDETQIISRVRQPGRQV